MGKIFDGVKETSVTAGVGDLVFAGAVPSFRAVGSVYADQETFPYSIRNATDFENGIGRYNLGANSMTRVEIKGSSNAGAAVNWPAGSKEIAVTLLAGMVEPIAPFPFSAAQCLLRINAKLSAKTYTAKSYCNKINDLSGNGNHSATNNTNPPKYIHRSLQGMPGLFFNGGQRLTFPGVPQAASPIHVTICGVGYDWGAPSGNSHIYNWAGNPIGFSATTSLEFIYNGTLPSGQPDSANIVGDQKPDGWLSHPAAFIHVYDSTSASMNKVNGSRQTGLTVGNSASGTTNSFTIGGDSSTGGASYNRMVLLELFVLNFSINATQEAQIDDYFKTNFRMDY